jgi:hypothetical protein
MIRIEMIIMTQCDEVISKTIIQLSTSITKGTVLGNKLAFKLKCLLRRLESLVGVVYTFNNKKHQREKRLMYS